MIDLKVKFDIKTIFRQVYLKLSKHQVVKGIYKMPYTAVEKYLINLDEIEKADLFDSLSNETPEDQKESLKFFAGLAGYEND